MPASSRFLTLAVLAAVLVPNVSVAQDAPVRLRNTPTLTRTTPSQTETLPVQRVIARAEPTEDERPRFVRTSVTIEPLSRAQRVAILAEGMDLSENTQPSISELTLTVQKPYTHAPEAWLSFESVSVDTRHNYAHAPPRSRQPYASIRTGFIAQAAQRYLIEYWLYVNDGGTIGAYGSISAERRLEPGPQRLLFVVEAQHDGIVHLNLQGVDTGSAFNGVTISRME